MICNSWMKTEGYQKVSRQPFRKWPFAFPIAFALVLIDFEKAVYYLFRQKERIDLICERQHPAASKRCLNHGPADLRTTQENETEQIFFFFFKRQKSWNERALLPSRGCNGRSQRGNESFSSCPATHFPWCEDTTFTHPLF